ncbi:MAG: hypothetical protein IJJ69_04815 [Oscillospiraceae bacterium]|nr:hypothetical protein [Oscillospiraceae bacterium]
METQENKEQSTAEKKKGATLSEYLTVIGVLAIAFLLLRGCVRAVSKTSSQSSGVGAYYLTYNSAVKGLTKAMEKADGEAICAAVFPDVIYVQLPESYFEEISSFMASSNKFLEEVFEEKVNYHLEIEEKTKLDETGIDRIRYYYQTNFNCTFEIEKAYRLETYYDDDSVVFLDVFKTSEDSWKVSEASWRNMIGISESYF